jgi:uncharacterized protein (TIGR03083 family)
MPKALGSKDFWLAALRAEAAAFRVAVAGAEPTAAVPSRPGWTITDLAAHLGGWYAFTSALLARGETGAHDQERPAPPAGVDLLTWWDEQLATLLAALERTDPDAPVWNWAPQSKTAAFWMRRMAHETAVHRWDAQFVTISAEPIETKLALDGIAEVLDTWLPAGRGTDGAGLTGVVGLVATDGGHEFFVRERPDGGVALLDTGTLLDTEPHERVVATGPASDILLVLYGRLDADVLEISGEARLLDALRVG